MNANSTANNPLQEQRIKRTFNLEDLSHMVYGSKENYEHFIQMQTLMENDPIFRNDPKFYSLSREDQFIAMSKQTSRVPILFPQKGALGLENLMPIVLFNNHQIAGSVHLSMVIRYLQLNSSVQQQAKWIPDAISFKKVGCYAQTELGQGSDIQNLQTTATFDEKTDQFILHTPSYSAYKFWPGDLGINANFAIVFAQLIIKGQSHGVQAFYVPIREQGTHKLLNGVDAGDIGPKIGYESKDNGYLCFTNFRIPRTNILAQYVAVERDGTFQRSQDANPQIFHATMMLTRAYICHVSPRFLGEALTIAIRYSLVRKQFKDSKGNERKIMDYQLQQEKLVNALADFYSFVASGFQINDMCNNNLHLVTDKNDSSKMAETHAVLCGGKSYVSELAFKHIETCRLACGGHGFSLFSGLPQIQTEYYAHNTHEGENTVLYLQVARFLIKNYQSFIMNQKGGNSSEATPDSVAYLKFANILLKNACNVESSREFFNQEIIRKLLATNSAFFVNQVFNKIAKCMKSGNEDIKSYMDKQLGIDLIEMAKAHMTYLIFVWFMEWSSNVYQEDLRNVLSELCILTGVNSILMRGSGLLEGNILKSDHFEMLTQVRDQLYINLRPNCLALVEALGHSDNSLRTAIGTRDGKWEETLYQWNKQFNPINEQPIFEEYMRQIKGIVNIQPLHPSL